MADEPKAGEQTQKPVDDHPLRQEPNAPPPGPTLEDLVKSADEQALKTALAGRTFTMKVNEQEKQVTFEELQQSASKAAGADEKFRQSAEGRKALDLLKRAREEGDAGAVLQLMKLGGASEEELQMAQGMFQEAEEGGKNLPGPQSKGPQQPQQPQPISVDQLPPEYRAAYEKQQAQEQAALQQQAKEIVYKSVDSDPVVARIKSEKGEEAFQDAQEIVWSEVWRRVALGKPFTYELIGEVQQSLRPRLTRLAGLAPAGTNQPDTYPSGGGYPGVGPAMGRSQSLAISGPPKRVPMTDPGYDKYMRDKQAWEQHQQG